MKNDNFWYRIFFKLKIYEASGESFQRLFQDIMNYRYPSFQSVAPYGNQGDGGNDGWIPEENLYCQVYGKKADATEKLPTTLKKVTDDFQKIQNNWGQIDKYYFIYNDRFEGAPAPIGKTLLALKIQFHLKDAAVWSASKLEQLFMELQEDQKQSILHNIPSDIPDHIDSRAVAEILKYLADRESSNDYSLLNQEPPNFDKKITFNGLAIPIKDKLRSHSYQVAYVDDFIKTRNIGSTVASEMKELYTASCTAIPDKEKDAPSIRYMWLVNKLIPPFTNTHTIKAYREAAQVVLAKYFEACDVYEDPSTAITPQTHSLF